MKCVLGERILRVINILHHNIIEKKVYSYTSIPTNSLNGFESVDYSSFTLVLTD